MSRWRGPVSMGVPRRIEAIVQRAKFPQDPSTVRLICGHQVSTFKPTAYETWCRFCTPAADPGLSHRALAESPNPKDAVGGLEKTAGQLLPPVSAAEQVRQRESHERWMDVFQPKHTDLTRGL